MHHPYTFCLVTAYSCKHNISLDWRASMGGSVCVPQKTSESTAENKNNSCFWCKHWAQSFCLATLCIFVVQCIKCTLQSVYCTYTTYCIYIQHSYNILIWCQPWYRETKLYYVNFTIIIKKNQLFKNRFRAHLSCIYYMNLYYIILLYIYFNEKIQYSLLSLKCSTQNNHDNAKKKKD